MVSIFFTYQPPVEIRADPVVADYCILKGRLCLLCMAMFLSSGEIMQDCVTAKQARIFSAF